ncbi:MAG: M23 family metallopeptidase [Sphingomonadales bacterium]|nr:M23 family metallopeptidase [Sphingomonadales bacterium]
MFQRSHFQGGDGGGAATLPLDRSLPPDDGKFDKLLREIDLVVDLGAQIGSRTWWRGALTCTALCASMLFLAPGVQALPEIPSAMDAEQWDEARAQAITPLAYGADTGRRMAATGAVEPLADTPERPKVELTATLGRGDGFARVLERAGVARDQAREIETMVAALIPVEDIEAGTPMKIVLGRRPNRTVPRPVDEVSFRARLDLRIELARADGRLMADAVAIAVDDTPLRIRGRVGSSLYRSARAAGAPPSAIQDFLRAVGTQLSIERDIPASATFDMIIEHRRAETGETELGQVLYAGIERGDRKTQLLRWTVGGNSQWFEASGVGRSTGEMLMPVSGRISSGFGSRRHPILGGSRMHTGIDIAAGYGTPIRAAATGTVNYSGRNGGYGNYVRINHGGGTQTAYAHMGRKVDPRSVRFIEQAQLTGAELARFRSTLVSLLNVEPGAALRRERTERASADRRTGGASRS